MKSIQELIIEITNLSNDKLKTLDLLEELINISAEDFKQMIKILKN